MGGNEEKVDVLGKNGGTGVADALSSHARTGQDELRAVVGIGEVARVDGRWSSGVAPGGVGGGGGGGVGGRGSCMGNHQEGFDGRYDTTWASEQGRMLECAWKSMLHPPRGHQRSQLSHTREMISYVVVHILGLGL